MPMTMIIFFCVIFKDTIELGVYQNKLTMLGGRYAENYSIEWDKIGMKGWFQNRKEITKQNGMHQYLFDHS